MSHSLILNDRVTNWRALAAAGTPAYSLSASRLQVVGATSALHASRRTIDPLYLTRVDSILSPAIEHRRLQPVSKRFRKWMQTADWAAQC